MTASSASNPTGLFGYIDLTSPEELFKIAERRILQVQPIVEAVQKSVASFNNNSFWNNESNETKLMELRRTVKRLDVVSDLICSIVDMCELIRNVHPDKGYVHVATEVHAALSNYLNQLNTAPGLYETLKMLLETPEIAKDLSREEKRVAELLIKDFEKSGIDLPERTRKKFVELNDDILLLGQRFLELSHTSVDVVKFKDPKSSLRGVPLSNFPQRKTIHTDSGEAYLVMTSCDVEESRKKMHVALNSANDEQIDILEKFLKARGSLASLLGKESYAHIVLGDQMAKTPENVVNFLSQLATQHKPLAAKALFNLQQLKKSHLNESDLPIIQAWDKQYYENLSRKMRDDHSNTPETGLLTLISVGDTFEAISMLFKTLYGVSLVPSPTKPGETWHKDVRRLDVVDEKEGQIGIIYCDLYQRAGHDKFESPAHFTIRCSRRIDDDGEDPLLRELGVISGGPSNESHALFNPDGEREFVGVDGVKKKYALPIVVLVSGIASQWTGLRMGEVETLFHEMGHAIHSMLARTDFQHIAGTRVPLDFVEVPSIFHELFIRHPHILQTLQSSISSGLSQHITDPAHQHNALEYQTQIQMALLDQMYHSPLFATSSPSNLKSGYWTSLVQPMGNVHLGRSTEILRDVTNNVNVIPYVDQTRWQVQFSHLVGYGANYYSYLWCRKWAMRLYKQSFAPSENGRNEKKGIDDDKWRDSGEKIKEALLKWGGGRDPWDGLEELGVVKDGEREGVFTQHLDDI